MKLKKSVFALLLCFALLLSGTFASIPVYAQHTHTESGLCSCGGVAINEINFPDGKFSYYVFMRLQSVRDHFLTSDEISAITVINLYLEGSFSSLVGIEFFTELEYLDCYGKDLTNLDVSKNTKLTSLNCSGNNLTSLDVSKNTALTELNCNGNKLTSIDVSKNTALTKLLLYNNNLLSINVSNNTALTELNCANNDLTSLDVSKNTKLTSLYCAYNNLTSLDVSNNTLLKYLVCDKNKLICLDLSNNLDILQEEASNQSPEITVDPDSLTVDLSGIDKNFDSTRVTELTEGCRFEGNVLHVPEDISEVFYYYYTTTNSASPFTLKIVFGTANEPPLGDLTGDDKIDSFDYMLVRASILGLKTLTEAQLIAADVNGDGKVDSFDYLLMRAHILGLTTIKGW